MELSGNFISTQNRPLCFGFSDVIELQQRLNEMGYTGADGKPLVIDGDFGQNTDYAVRQYQKNDGLTVDGLVGDQTWSNMGLVFSLPYVGTPNSTAYDYNPDGSIKQKREYGPDGKATKDTDYNHGGVGHTFPHEHEWDWNSNSPRQPATPVPDTSDATNAITTQLGGTAILLLFLSTMFGSVIGY